ncbi:MAG: hypothetical protein ABFR90_04565 [Planctomycetota bacterium]
MVLNEAIRQGQAKIAEGLKTGQMRSDNLPTQTPSKNNEQTLDGIATGRVELLTSKEKSTFGGILTPRAKLMLLAGIALLIVVIWFVAALMNREPSELPESSTVPGFKTETAELKGRESVQKREALPEWTGQTDPENEVPSPAVSKGANVIWIQSIDPERKDELVPIAEFFERKGVATEIIAHRDTGDAILVTKAGFEENPVKKGTDGYKLLQRIKQLGIVYAEETKDTKFGVKPFQDALGYKR